MSERSHNDRERVRSDSISISSLSQRRDSLCSVDLSDPHTTSADQSSNSSSNSKSSYNFDISNVSGSMKPGPSQRSHPNPSTLFDESPISVTAGDIEENSNEKRSTRKRTNDIADRLTESKRLERERIANERELASHLPRSQLYEGFRVRIDKLPERQVEGNEFIGSIDNSSDQEIGYSSDSIGAGQGGNALPSSRPKAAGKLSWSEFERIEHQLDSSSCHIYTALWHQRPVILKLIKADRIKSAVALSEFEMEVSVLSRLKHENIVRFLGSGDYPRRFLVLEYLEGGTLSTALGIRDAPRPQASSTPSAGSLLNSSSVSVNSSSSSSSSPNGGSSSSSQGSIVSTLSSMLGLDGFTQGKKKKKKFSYLETLELARSLASALCYIHSRWHGEISIIHRDLKPDNIGFDGQGVVKLFDFGLSASVKKTSLRPTKSGDLESPSAPSSSSSSPHSPNSGNFSPISFASTSPVISINERSRGVIREKYQMTGNTGTLRYMAPECALGKGYNETVDVYSFGVIVWQILRGQVPFEKMNKKTYINKVVLGKERPLIDRRWPVQFSDLLQRCWHDDCDQRPSFDEVLVTLDELISSGHQSHHFLKFLCASESGRYHHIYYCIHPSIFRRHKRHFYSGSLVLTFLAPLIYYIGLETAATCICLGSLFLAFFIAFSPREPAGSATEQIDTSGKGVKGDQEEDKGSLASRAMSFVTITYDGITSRYSKGFSPVKSSSSLVEEAGDAEGFGRTARFQSIFNQPVDRDDIESRGSASVLSKTGVQNPLFQMTDRESADI